MQKILRAKHCRRYVNAIVLFFNLISLPSFANALIPISYLTTYINHNSLMMDAKNIFTLPRHFRTTLVPASSEKLKEHLRLYRYLPSFEGYRDLNASGSSQFSENNILAALTFMQGKVYIVDLRQESHGFLNGNAISWSDKRNWGNQGKTYEFVNTLELNLLEHLNHQKHISLCFFPYIKQKHFCNQKPYTFNIQTAETEEQLTKRLGLEYKRFPVLDHWPPDNQVLDQFVKFVKELPENAWLHFHCRGGSGRTTTFLVLYDIIRNGKYIKLDDIISRHALTGVRDLQKIPHVQFQEWKTDGALKRLDTVRNFYTYVNDPEGYAIRSWSEWLNYKKAEFTSNNF